MSSSSEISKTVLEQAILWCNSNSGFLTAILSLLTLFTSVIAIAVSIKTARLPYKKKGILSSSIMYGLFSGIASSGPQTVGLSAGFTNAGNRAVNIQYLGYAIQRGKKFNRIYPINRDFICSKIIAPAESFEVKFYSEELIKAFCEEPKDEKLYVYAIDSENQEYTKKAGTVGVLIKNLTS